MQKKCGFFKTYTLKRVGLRFSANVHFFNEVDVPSDALNYHYLAQELNLILSGGRIDKITMPQKNGVVLFVRSSGQNHRLLISAEPSAPRCHLSCAEHENPAAAPGFLMHLRKHILGGKIENISAQDGERVLKIKITAKTELGFCEEKTLIAEIMGKYSNIILIDSESKISDCIRRVTPDISSKRTVLPSLPYSPPPAQDKISCMTQAELKPVLEGFEGGKLQGYILSRVCSLAPVSIDEAVFRCFKDNPPKDFSDKNAGLLAKELCGLFSETDLRPCVLMRDKKAADFFFAPYSHLDGDYKFFGTLSEAMDFYFSFKSDSSVLGERLKRLDTAVRNASVKCVKRLELLHNKNAECADYELERLRGELITANIYAIKPGQKIFEAQNYYSENNEIVLIALDNKLSAQKNAQNYFKRYSKKKKTLDMNAEQIIKAQGELEYLDSVAVSLALCKDKDDIKEIEDELTAFGLIKKSQSGGAKQKQAGAKFSRVEFFGYTVIYGKNNAQNDFITKNASPYDLWLHIKDAPGSHVIIKNNSKDFPPDEAILFAARLAALNSKMRGADKAAVDYTFIKNVTKPKGAPLGKVVYENQYTVFVTINDE